MGSICKAFKALEIRSGGKLLPPSSLSAGIAIAPNHGMAPEVILRVADGALYAAKLGGRDRVAIAEINPPHPSGPKDA